VSSHRERIIDQFTRRAVPFSTAPGIKSEDALKLLVAASGAEADDLVLDVACGPGLVVAALAAVARQVVGLDLTPAMLDRARELTAGLTNVVFDQGEAAPLPYADASFDVVVSRFSFHHFQDPKSVLFEMRRVCKPGGRVVVCDLLAAEDPSKAAAFHAVEIMRDPSHVRALTLAELTGLFARVHLTSPNTTFYQLAFELEGLLARSFPCAEHVPLLRAAYTASLEDDALGLGTHRVGDEVHAAYSVAILAATR
jgi:SAM-dependent methyltransferase